MPLVRRCIDGEPRRPWPPYSVPAKRRRREEEPKRGDGRVIDHAIMRSKCEVSNEVVTKFTFCLFLLTKVGIGGSGALIELYIYNRNASRVICL